MRARDWEIEIETEIHKERRPFPARVVSPTTAFLPLPFRRRCLNLRRLLHRRLRPSIRPFVRSSIAMPKFSMSTHKREHVGNSSLPLSCVNVSTLLKGILNNYLFIYLFSCLCKLVVVKYFLERSIESTFESIVWISAYMCVCICICMQLIHQGEVLKN